MSFREKVGDVVREIRNPSSGHESREIEEVADAQEENTVAPEMRRFGAPVSDSASQYYQWYERDPERLATEKEAMQQRDFESRVYPDGRIVFVGHLSGDEVLSILDYLYPLKPPSVYLLTRKNSIPDKLLNEDGSIDLLRAGNSWEPNTMMASTMIDLLQQLLVFCEQEDTKPDGKEEEI